MRSKLTSAGRAGFASLRPASRQVGQAEQDGRESDRQQHDAGGPGPLMTSTAITLMLARLRTCRPIEAQEARWAGISTDQPTTARR
jgi:hypothetical protein